MSSRRNRGGGAHGDAEERWLLPYADMITLLLGLFIVLFAMSSIDAQKFDSVASSLSETFKGSVLENSGSVLDGSNGPGDPSNANQIPDKTIVTEMIQASNATAARFDEEQKQLRSITKGMKLGANVEVSQSRNGSIVLRIAGDALFKSGSAELQPGIRADLVQIERELARFGARVEISGHTDGAPIAGGNHRLGFERALTVTDLFQSAGFPGYIKASSSANQDPIVVPEYPTQSVAKNRRIEIHVLAPGADDARPETVQKIDSARRMIRASQATHADHGPVKPVTPEIKQEIAIGIAGELAAIAQERK